MNQGDKATERSPARALAMRFWEIRTVAGAEDLPAWDELTPYERSRKVKSAEYFIANNIAVPIEEKAVKAERKRVEEHLARVWKLLDKIAEVVAGRPSRMHADQTTDGQLASEARVYLRAALEPEEGS